MYKRQDYECLGMSFIKERYQESTTLFIGDETSPYEDLSLKLGRFPQNQHEILVSLSTAQHLCQNEDISLLIDKAVYVYYQHGLEVKPIAFHVVGITTQTTSLDTCLLYTSTSISSFNCAAFSLIALTSSLS